MGGSAESTRPKQPLDLARVSGTWRHAHKKTSSWGSRLQKEDPCNSAFVLSEAGIQRIFWQKIFFEQKRRRLHATHFFVESLS